MNPVNQLTRVREWWTESRKRSDQRQLASDRLTRDGLGWLHPADTGEQLAVTDGKAQAPDDWGRKEGVREKGRARRHRPVKARRVDPTYEDEAALISDVALDFAWLRDLSDDTLEYGRRLHTWVRRIYLAGLTLAAAGAVWLAFMATVALLGQAWIEAAVYGSLLALNGYTSHRLLTRISLHIDVLDAIRDETARRKHRPADRPGHRLPAGDEGVSVDG